MRALFSCRREPRTSRIRVIGGLHGFERVGVGWEEQFMQEVISSNNAELISIVRANDLRQNETSVSVIGLDNENEKLSIV
jgi:hypothetical protein